MDAELARQASRTSLLAAQRELERRREELARVRAAEQRPLARQESARRESREPTKTAVSWQLYNAQKELVARREQMSRGARGQWGWGDEAKELVFEEASIQLSVSERETAVGRQESPSATVVAQPEYVGGGSAEPKALAEEVSVAQGTVRVYPTLATAVLRAELAAAGRVYWLLRHVDEVGRGWLTVEQMREVLTKRESTLRVCGWRRLRQLLQQGEGKLWERDGRGRLWLYSPARILERLDGSRFEGRPVAVPVAKLLGRIGEVRAYLYATFHAGRSVSRPITRGTIREKTAVSATTQRRYEQVAQIQVRANVALGGRWGAVGREQAAWERGRAAFEFVDGAGEQGVVNGRYIAWRLGNCYESGLVQLPKGRQKKLNQRLPLVNDGRGGREMGIERLYYPNGKAAAQAATRRPERDYYFPAHKAGVWQVVGGSP